jgi:hypothetical protein
VVLIVLSLLLILPFVRFHLRYDALHYYEPVRSLLIDGDVNTYNERAYWTERRWPGFEEAPLFRPAQGFLGFMSHPDRTPAGYKFTFFPAGSQLLLLPWAAGGNLVARAVVGLSGGGVVDGYEDITLALTAQGALAMGVLGLALSWWLCRRLFGPSSALFGVAAVLLAHNVIPYLAVDPLYSHSLALLLISAFFVLRQRARENGARPLFFFYGLVGGLLPITRYQDIFLLLIPFVDLVLDRRGARAGGQRRRIWGQSVAFLLGVVVALLPQLAWWRVQHGTWLISPKAMGTSDIPTFNPLRPDPLGLLFSNLHGLFSWTPLVLLAVVGVVLVGRRDRRLAGHLLVALAIQTYYNSCRSEWWNLGYGVRRYANYALFFALGFAALHGFFRRRGWRIALWGLLLVAGAANVTLMAQYYDGETLTQHGRFYSRAVGKVQPYAYREYRLAVLPPRLWIPALADSVSSLVRRGALFRALRGSPRRELSGSAWLGLLLLGSGVAIAGPFLLLGRLGRLSPENPALALTALLPLSLAFWLLLSDARTQPVLILDPAQDATVVRLESIPLHEGATFVGENTVLDLAPGQQRTYRFSEPRDLSRLQLNVEAVGLAGRDAGRPALTIVLEGSPKKGPAPQAVARFDVTVAQLLAARGQRALIPGEPRASARISVLRFSLPEERAIGGLTLAAPVGGPPLRISAIAFRATSGARAR